MYMCWLEVTQIPYSGWFWYVLLVPILSVLGFTTLADYPLEVATPSKVGNLCPG
jgi:hypothetical protein